MPFSFKNIERDDSGDFGLQQAQAIGDPEQYRPVANQDTSNLRWGAWSTQNGFNEADEQTRSQIAGFYQQNVLPQISAAQNVPVERLQSAFAANVPEATRFQQPVSELEQRKAQGEQFGLSGDALQQYIFNGKLPAPTAPKERRIAEGADGFKYYTDTGERVFEGVQARPRNGVYIDEDGKLVSENQTKGSEAADKEFAKDYAQWVQGGQEKSLRNIATLKDAITRLQSGEENLTGAQGFLPDGARTLFGNENSVEVRQNVENVVQQSLREILGGQFAQKEAEQLIKRAYNETLDESTNAKRVAVLLTQIERAMIQKNEAAEYFAKNGTLSGFNKPTPTISDFNNALDQTLGNNSQEEEVNQAFDAYYNALPSGSRYIAPDGTTRTKP